MGFPEAAIPPDDSVRLELKFGDITRVFTGKDTLVRCFDEGDGEYDHCVHILPDGKKVAFTPTREALDEFISLGFHVRTDDKIDAATMDHYAKVQGAHIDEERMECEDF